jgi:hypothetical protein
MEEKKEIQTIYTNLRAGLIEEKENRQILKIFRSQKGTTLDEDGNVDETNESQEKPPDPTTQENIKEKTSKKAKKRRETRGSYSNKKGIRAIKDCSLIYSNRTKTITKTSTD